MRFYRPVRRCTENGGCSAVDPGGFYFIYSNIQAVQQAGGCNGKNTTADYANALIAGINSVNGVS